MADKQSESALFLADKLANEAAPPGSTRASQPLNFVQVAEAAALGTVAAHRALSRAPRV